MVLRDPLVRPVQGHRGDHDHAQRRRHGHRHIDPAAPAVDLRPATAEPRPHLQASGEQGDRAEEDVGDQQRVEDRRVRHRLQARPRRIESEVRRDGVDHEPDRDEGQRDHPGSADQRRPPPLDDQLRPKPVARIRSSMDMAPACRDEAASTLRLTGQPVRGISLPRRGQGTSGASRTARPASSSPVSRRRGSSSPTRPHNSSSRVDAGPTSTASAGSFRFTPAPASVHPVVDPSGRMPRRAGQRRHPTQPDLAREEHRDHLVDAVEGQFLVVTDVAPDRRTQIPAVHRRLMGLAPRPEGSGTRRRPKVQAAAAGSTDRRVPSSASAAPRYQSGSAWGSGGVPGSGASGLPARIACRAHRWVSPTWTIRSATVQPGQDGTRRREVGGRQHLVDHA